MKKIRTIIRPTPKAALLFAFSVPVSLIMVTAFRDIWYISLYLPVVALFLMLSDLSRALPSGSISALIDLPRRLYVGRPGTAGLTFDLRGYSRKTPLQVLVEYTNGDRPQILYPLIGEGETRLNFTIIPRKRGQIHVRTLWLRWRGPFGLMEIRRTQGIDERIDVVPDVHGIHEAALQFFSHDAVYGVKTQRMRGEGTEFDNLREYTQGMDNRFIDWKHSARHRKLLCKEFRQERNHQIIMGFDTGHLMLEPVEGMPKLDHAIKAGLLLSWISLYSGDLVGGCGFDARFRHFINPGRGMPYFAKFQSFAAALDYHAEETNFTLGLMELNSRLKRRALIVLFTEFVDAISAELLLESLHIMSKKHVVMFVTMRDPYLYSLQNRPPNDFSSIAEAVLSGDFLRERAIVLEKVARLGVHCVDAPARGFSAALLNRYLIIKQRGLL